MLVELTTPELKDLIENSMSKAIQKAKLVNQSVDEILNIKQAAALLGVSLPTLHKYKKKGIIPYHKNGGRVFFKKAELVNSI